MYVRKNYIFLLPHCGNELFRVIQLSNPKNSHLETRPKLLLFTICKCIVMCILVDIEPIKTKIVEKNNSVPLRFCILVIISNHFTIYV